MRAHEYLEVPYSPNRLLLSLRRVREKAKWNSPKGWPVREKPMDGLCNALSRRMIRQQQPAKGLREFV